MKEAMREEPLVKTLSVGELEGEEHRFRNTLFERSLNVQVQAQGVDRSYEDREVFLNIKHQFEGNEEASPPSSEITEWLRAEQAIELGQALIRQGQKAYHANMVHHQLVHCWNTLRGFVIEERVEKVTLKVIEDYGTGVRKYLVIPRFFTGKEPEHLENFCFEELINFSPFEEEYKQQLSGFGVEVEFEGYDREAEVEEFKKLLDEHEKEHK